MFGVRFRALGTRLEVSTCALERFAYRVLEFRAGFTPDHRGGDVVIEADRHDVSVSRPVSIPSTPLTREHVRLRS